jgi:peptidylprolyl isomerase
MAKTHQRVFALLFALLFLFSTVALSAAVVYTIYKEKQDDNISGDFDASGGDASPEEASQGSNKMLKGTKLEEFQPIKDDVSQLQILDIEQGDGEEAKAGATITAHYTGAYAVNGEIFESSKDSGSPLKGYPLDNLIPGWIQGIPGMKEGGKRRLIIPGNLAYGDAPENYVPGSGDRPLGVLIFDIELIEVTNK